MDDSPTAEAVRPAARPAATCGICELTLETRDLDRLARFYAGVFGMQAISREDDRVWLACGKRARLGLWLPGEKEFGDEGGRHVHFALSIERGTMERLVEHLRAMGHPFRGPVEHEGGDRSLYLEDPEGNVVEVWDYFEHGEGARDGVAALAS